MPYTVTHLPNGQIFKLRTTINNGVGVPIYTYCKQWKFHLVIKVKLVKCLTILMQVCVSLVNIPQPVQYNIHTLDFPFDLWCESVTLSK